MKSGVLWSSNWFLGIRLIISNNINYGLRWNLGYSIMIYAQGRVGSEDILVSLTWRYLGEQQKVDDLKFVSITILCGALLDLHFLGGAFWVVRLPSKVFARTAALGKIMMVDNLWNDISLLLIGVARARTVWNHLSTCYSIVKWLLISSILCVFFWIFCVIL